MDKESRHLILKRVLDVLLLTVTLVAVGAPFWQEAPEWLGVTILSLFVFLFFFRWIVSDDRHGYLRANWLDLVLVVLLSSPFLRLLVAFKVAGLAPVLRLGAVFRKNRHKLLHMLVLSGESLPAALALVFGVVFLFGAGVFLLEQDTNPAFVTISDGLWWAFVTLTTVGYGDIVPITPAGRMLAVVTMLFGITLYSLMIANLTHFVEEISSDDDGKGSKDNRLRKKLTGKCLDPMVRRPRKLRLKKFKT
ncbi:MAG: potassium channel family protein [Ghiorsea sp.]|nr:potassium channel family protein [Ghiorsea sp.]